MKKTVVITGGTGGIGKYTAIALARAGARVVVTGRDSVRGEAGVKAIREASASDDVHLALGDLARLDGIAALASAITLRHPKIDVLVNNAGLLAQTRSVTSDGIESDLAVNVVAPYVLTHALSDALEAAGRRASST